MRMKTEEIRQQAIYAMRNYREAKIRLDQAIKDLDKRKIDANRNAINYWEGQIDVCYMVIYGTDATVEWRELTNYCDQNVMVSIGADEVAIFDSETGELSCVGHSKASELKEVAERWIASGSSWMNIRIVGINRDVFQNIL